MVKSIQHMVNGVNICVDSKVELMGIFITLSDESSIDRFKRLFDFGENNDEYINAIKNDFSYLIETGLIERFNKIKSKYHLHYQEPIKLMLMLDDEFSPESLEKYCGKKPEQDFYDFVSELKEVYESLEFVEFYNNNMNRYDQWVKSVAPFYEKFNMSDIITTYCGNKYKNLELYNNLISFETSGGYGIYLGDEAHYCSRAFSSKNTTNNDLFAPKDIDSRLKIVIHEFLHSVVNPITDKYNIFNHESNYFEKTDRLSFSGYGTDYSLINETIVRAITIKLYSSIIKEVNAEALLDLEYNQGFIFIKDIYNLLSEYENNRDIYLDVDSFYKNFVFITTNGDKVLKNK